MPFLLQLSTLTPAWSLSLPTILVGLAAISTALAAAAFVYVRFFYVDFPSIDGLPEIPGAEPLAGHMYRLGEDHASMTEKWALQYNWPVFQIRMGQRRAIVLNSFESARAFMIQNQAATLDRPWFHTFHGVVSATSAATIGTSPWNDHTKKQRRIVGSLTTGPEIQRLGRMLDLETCAMVSSMYYDSSKGTSEIAPHMYKKRVSLNIMTMFCYGTRFASVTNPMMAQILEDASTIASFRSTYTIMTDFIPHLRYGKSGAKNTKAVEVRGRRDKWLAALLDAVRQKLVTTATGKKVPSNTGARLTVAELILTDSQQGITEMDVKTILGGLMSGGFETVYSTAIIAVGMLSTPEGQHIQQQAFDDIMSHYSTPEEAFAKCVSEEKSAYVAGLVKEALRFYPPLKLLPARQTYKSFEYGNATIPKGILVYMNAQAINRDKATYGEDADQFRPERWLPGNKERSVPPPYHFSYGAGARACTAVNFSNRVLYAMFFRLIVAFKITPSATQPANTDYVQYKEDPTATNAIPSPFKVHLTPRDKDALERCFVTSQENTEGMMTGDSMETFKRE